MAKIKDVADRAGVSVATVSRVLNHNPNVKLRLRKRVEDVIAELGYFPSGIARNMRNQSARVIGLIITDIQNPFFTSLVRAVEDVAYENRYKVLLCNSDEDPEKEQSYCTVLSEERVAGAIVIPTISKGCDALNRLKVPVVFADRRVDDTKSDSVTIDNVAGAYQATMHLIQLCHSRIGLISAPTHVSVGFERNMGYENALREAGIPIRKELIRTGNFMEDGGYKATCELLSLHDRPTAIFAVNNLMTQGALKAIHEFGLRIPLDISLVGFDDMPWFLLLVPPLTAVRQPTYEIGRLAAELLLGRINGENCSPPQAIVLKPELIIRGSTARRGQL